MRTIPVTLTEHRNPVKKTGVTATDLYPTGTISLRILASWYLKKQINTLPLNQYFQINLIAPAYNSESMLPVRLMSRNFNFPIRLLFVRGFAGKIMEQDFKGTSIFLISFKGRVDFPHIV